MNPLGNPKLIILDRDGVINEDSDEYIKTPDEWIPIPGSLEAIAALNRAGYQVVVATNQSGLARGLYTETMLKQIHDRMQQQLAAVGGHFDGIFYCPHHPDDHCDCRKPNPGLLRQIAAQFHIEFKDALLVGDAKRDLDCAQAVGCSAVLVKTGKGLRTLAANPVWAASVAIYEDLAAVVAALTNSK
jgi:D-glycero-D-manno-heptose 1,7-bisphosphate phosphatase